MISEMHRQISQNLIATLAVTNGLYVMAVLQCFLYPIVVDVFAPFFNTDLRRFQVNNLKLLEHL